jgi:hypothetical protein
MISHTTARFHETHTLLTSSDQRSEAMWLRQRLDRGIPDCRLQVSAGPHRIQNKHRVRIYQEQVVESRTPPTCFYLDIIQREWNHNVCHDCEYLIVNASRLTSIIQQHEHSEYCNTPNRATDRRSKYNTQRRNTFVGPNAIYNRGTDSSCQGDCPLVPVGSSHT